MKKQQYDLSWTPKQITIFIDLQNGLKPNEIVKAHKFSFSAVTHVKNAIAKGEHPTDPQIKKAKGQNDSSSKQKASLKKVKPEAKEPSPKPEEQADPSQTKPPQASAPKNNVKTDDCSEDDGEEKEQASKITTTSVGSEVEAKLTVTPAIIPITPIMRNWRAYLMQLLSSYFLLAFDERKITFMLYFSYCGNNEESTDESNRSLYCLWV